MTKRLSIVVALVMIIAIVSNIELAIAATEIRVNAGGGNYIDGNGYLWSADYGYNTGRLGSTSHPISGTADDVLYQSERWDAPSSPELSYGFEVSNGDYTVNLYFVDLYDGTAGVGLRVFDVLIEGQLVLNDLDIFSEVGHDAALVKSFPVTVSDGQLNIEFIHQVQDPKISAIEIMSSPTIGLPFFEDFSDGVAEGWGIVDNSGNTSDWEVIDGSYYQIINVEDGGNSFDETYHLGTYSLLLTGITLTDYRFSVDATPLSDLGHDIGVMFRYQDNNNYYRLSFSSKYGFGRLEKKLAGHFIPLTTDARGYIKGEPLNIAVEVSGDVIQVYLNGDPLFSTYDSSFGWGTVALYCQDKAKFDNVLIEENSTVPSITISTPVAYSVNVTNTLDVSAIVTNMPLNGSVQFVLDGTTSIVSSISPYAVQFTGVSLGEHELDAILRDVSTVEQARDTNEGIGVAGDCYISVGDSITNGTGDNYSFDNISNDGKIIAIQGYEAVLNNLLTSSLSVPHIDFNEGIPGDESYDAAYSRIDSILERHPKSNKVLILLGTNDAGAAVPSGLGCSGVSCNGTYKQNMQALIDAITAAGKKAFVALVPPSFGGSNPLTSSRNALIKNYNLVITSELSNIEPEHPDLFFFFLNESANRFSLFKDKLHPNGLGHVVMAHLWHEALTGNTEIPFILDNLTPSTVAPFLKQNLLEIGDTYYVDESFTLNSIPFEILDGRWVMTANNDKGNISSEYLSFDVDRNVTVYVAYDANAAAHPDWLSNDGFTFTGLQLSTSDPAVPTLDLYSRNYTSGSHISLGGNLAAGANGSLANYIVIVKEN